MELPSHTHYLRPKQAAQFLAVSPATFWRWHRNPDFPRGRKLGRQVTVFDRQELLDWSLRRALTRS